MTGERCEFHSHSLLSDGALLPIELWRRAEALGHRALCITDHVSLSNVERVVEELLRDCRLAEALEIIPLAGVEVTHVPPKAIPQVVRAARRAGAEIVIVHGETLAEPVLPGTNAAAVAEPEVDILAHPGLLTVQEAETAKANDIFVEISARKGHSLTNGHVAGVVERVGARPVVDADAHEPGDLITQEMAVAVALGSGLPGDLVEAATIRSPRELLKRAAKI
jgi:histidinol phosphatase-like PHP family hydrolase